MRKRSCFAKQYRLNDAQRALVEDNYKLVPYTVSRYFDVPQHHLEDILQIGAIGLCRAAYEYDPDRQNNFSTFAVRCIRTNIGHYYRLLYMDCRDVRRELLTMDGPVNTEDSDSGYFVDYLPDVTADVEMEVCGRLEAERLLRELANVPMSEKERYVLDRHLAGKTQRQIAKELGVTHSRVGQALKLASRKARAWLEEEQREEPTMKANPNFPALVGFVVYNPETEEYMAYRASCGNGDRRTYWTKDVQRAKRYHYRRNALEAANAIEHDGHGKAEVKMLKNVE